jgi:coenzyme PQQ biosynthesis protein PqqD
MNPETVLKANPMLAWREIDGSIVIISPERSMVHELNPTASFIWKRVNGRRTTDEIAEQLAAEFDVTRESALADVHELVESLVANQLVSALELIEVKAHV